MTLPGGVGVALITLFDDDLAVDVAATAAHAGRLADAGMRHVLVAGSTGEAATLDRAERAALVHAVRAALPDDVAVIAGTGAPSGHQAALLTRDALEAGADAVIALSPPRTDDPRPYYATVREAAGDAVLLGYHFPVVSPPGIGLDVLDDLGVDACKDSTGDAGRLLVEMTRHTTPIYVGSPALALLAGAVRAAGAILALANAMPEDCAAAYAGSVDAQLRIGEALPVLQSRFPGGIKQLTAAAYGTPTASRAG